jgi:hypothetical protein
MTRFGDIIAAAHHVAICDSVSRGLSHAATSGFMQYNSTCEANRAVPMAGTTGTVIAECGGTSGQRLRRLQQGLDEDPGCRSTPSRHRKQSLGESQDA